MAPKNNFWRIAGLSYLQFLNVASLAVRTGLKVCHNVFALSQSSEGANLFLIVYFRFPFLFFLYQEPAKSRALARQHIFYNKTVGDVKSKFWFIARSRIIKILILLSLSFSIFSCRQVISPISMTSFL